MNKNVLSYLQCINCTGSLNKKNTNLFFCLKCNKEYILNGKVFESLNKKAINKVNKFSKERWEDIYEVQQLDRKYEKDETIKSYKRFVDKYRKYYKGKIFLDLGCGIGWLDAMLAKQGNTIFCVDISKVALQKTVQIFKREKIQGNFFQADLFALPFKTNSIDFIYSCMAFEYVKDLQRAIDEAYRVLKPNSRAVIAIPVLSLTTLTYQQLRGDIPRIPIIYTIVEYIHMKLLKGKYMKYGYVQTISVNRFINSLNQAGFNVIKYGYYDMYFPLPNLPTYIRNIAWKLLKHRILWPIAYFEIKK